MKNMGAKLVKLVLGFLFLMHLLHAFQDDLKYENGLSAPSGNKYFSTGRKFKADLKPDEDSPKPVVPKKDNDLEHSPASDPTDLEREMDNLMKHDYPSRMKPRKRSPIHN
ncbi:PREDICTED: uncharacterized protein LOC104820985 [Tarenaya hassleriana]|uniref:uncharacterized protein LOC104820985 n=1 Tax=Tarenaya hassleriana TaxID=28532 RepID=UPI00053C7F55|nr:PREDICTED: uncharacterized protein LOC104820985 [Tarenaya hassleriana]